MTVLQSSDTGGPRYPRTYYLRIRLSCVKLDKKVKFLVKTCLFICEFSTRGPKYQEVSTKNNEAHLYGAIQIIRDTFLAYFRPPPSPMYHLVTLTWTTPPPV